MDNPFLLLLEILRRIENKLGELDCHYQRLKSMAGPGPAKLLVIEEAATFLALSIPTIYGLVSRGEIPCMKKGKRLYFSREELLAWVQSGRKKI